MDTKNFFLALLIGTSLLIASAMNSAAQRRPGSGAQVAPPPPPPPNPTPVISPR